MTQHYYQWLPGTENAGEVVRLSKMYVEDGEVFYIFDNGAICCEEYIAAFTLDKTKIGKKFLVEIPSPNQKWSFEEITSKKTSSMSDVQHEGGGDFEIPCIDDYTQNGTNINSKVGTYNIIAPKTRIKNIEKPDYFDYMSDDDLISLGLKAKDDTVVVENSITDITNTNTNVISIKHEPTNVVINETINTSNKLCDSSDPVFILVDKSVKYPSSVDIALNIDLPSISLFKTVSENFENGTEKFIEYIIQHIDYSTIKESLREGLMDAYLQKISSEN